ncbi:enoyl-CoA hydratase-related protein [Elongatibacter sediminis]|uniref:Enoyl-CoA hydratase-related protein n=1 Tax=Elongatibacter sediminis TaxID=3119006 RepID=A0AAW9RJP7_9GAMM
MSHPLRQHRDSRGVLTLTLNRPEVHNAFGDELIAQLSTVLQETRDDPAIRAIVLTGAGKSFSAGADMNWMRGMAAASAGENEQDALRLARMLRQLNYHPKPVIARINGAAMGGGVGLVACCDLTVASTDARFALSEVRLGLVPAVISPYVFRRIGEGHARRYFLSGERFDAARAQAIGLVQDVVAAESLDTAVEARLDDLLRGGPEALGHAKELVFAAAGQDLERQRRIDHDNARLIARLRVSAEGQEGLGAFLDKRTAQWMNQEDAKDG